MSVKVVEGSKIEATFAVCNIDGRGISCDECHAYGRIRNNLFSVESNLQRSDGWVNVFCFFCFIVPFFHIVEQPRHKRRTNRTGLYVYGSVGLH